MKDKFDKIIKISAWGCDKRFVSFDTTNGKRVVLRISQFLYNWFKSCGVPTCQSLRRK